MNLTERFEDCVCVRCGSALEGQDQGLQCVECRQVYPVIGGVPVLLHRPMAALRGGQMALEQCRSELPALERQSQWALGQNPSDGSRQRIDRWRRGTAANLELVERYSAPITEHLSQSSDEPFSLLDWASSRDVGWTESALLPYFHQDWSDGTGFDQVRALVSGALAKHAPGAQKIAVLGAGACGLVHALASRAELVYGVDLCLPALLMARAAMRGEPMTLSLSKAGWRTVEIARQRSDAENISLIQANVNALPFADGGLTVIVTQYLLDLMGNPLWLADEIQRVLAPNGVWINFSNPFPMQGEAEQLGRPDLAEVREILGARRWTVVEAQRHEFVLNDVRGVYADAVRQPQEVHFFVARKQLEQAVEDHGRRWLRDSAWWRCTTEVIPGVDVRVLREHRTDADDSAASLLSIGGASFSVPHDVAESVGLLFQQLDRGLPLDTVAVELEQLGMPLSRPEFRELVHYLSEHYGFIRLSQAREPG